VLVKVIVPVVKTTRRRVVARYAIRMFFVILADELM